MSDIQAQALLGLHLLYDSEQREAAYRDLGNIKARDDLENHLHKIVASALLEQDDNGMRRAYLLGASMADASMAFPKTNHDAHHAETRRAHRLQGMFMVMAEYLVALGAVEPDREPSP